MIEITNNNFEVISKSQNLRGIIRYNASKSPVEYIVINRGFERCGNFEVIFSNGNTCKSFFASFDIAVNWFARFHLEKTVISENCITYISNR